MSDWFHRTIVETGRVPLLCFFVALIVAFGVIRLSVRLIRANVRWWPGNIESGGLHVHHMVFGVILMVLGGVAGFALPDRAAVGLAVTASIFGIGVALVLDEFALILHLQDVYWTEAGRESIDAIFVAIAVSGLLLLGLHPDLGLSGAFTDDGSGRAVTVLVGSILVGVNLGLAAITLVKGKIWTGMLGLFIPVFVMVGAIRVARPHSPWARWRYRGTRGAHKLAKAEHREVRYRQPLIRLKIRVQEAIGGRPDAPS